MNKEILSVLVFVIVLVSVLFGFLQFLIIADAFLIPFNFAGVMLLVVSGFALSVASATLAMNCIPR